MKIFPPEPTVRLYEEGFEENDLLDRKRVGKSLSDLIERIDDPIVVALDGGWGAGKTYFLKRWVGAHELEEERRAKTVYFDAFASDYLSDPLPALVATIAERFPEEKENAVRRMKSAAFALFKPLARVGLAFATYGATEVASAAGDALVNATSGEASKALENYWSEKEGRHAAMAEFHTAVEELLTSSADAGKETQPNEGNVGVWTGLVVVIDELDRCRPDYALEVLEVVKHFFAIPLVSFVLGANISALENSVKARYGAEIDASSYLRKFINVTFSLPSEIGDRYNAKDTSLVYLKHHLAEMETPQHLAERLKNHLELVSRNNKVSIRDTGKILSAVSLLDGEILESNRVLHGWIDVTVTLLVSKIIRPDLYSKFLNASISKNELEDYFDATPERRTKIIDDDHNPHCDHATWIQYNTWLYLVQSGELPDEAPENVKAFGAQFSSWGKPDDPKSVPRDANRKWIDLFSMSYG